MALLRKVDRGGVIECADEGMAGLSAFIVAPSAEYVNNAIIELSKKEMVIWDGKTLLIPKFIEAQESSKSDKLRQKESRLNRKSLINNDNKNTMSQNVTKCHELSQPVTQCHSSFALLPLLPVPSLKDLGELEIKTETSAPLAKTPKPFTKPSGKRADDAKNASPPPFRELTDLLCLEFEKQRNCRYEFSVKDGAQLSRLRRKEGAEEILRRWREGLKRTDWYRVDTVAQLVSRWNELAAPPASRVSKSPTLAESQDFSMYKTGDIHDF
jgi:hypothetical protein